MVKKDSSKLYFLIKGFHQTEFHKKKLKAVSFNTMDSVGFSGTIKSGNTINLPTLSISTQSSRYFYHDIYFNIPFYQIKLFFYLNLINKN